MAKSSARKAKAKRRGQKRAGKKMMSFDKRVQAVVSRNMEDKFTKTKVYVVEVCQFDGPRNVLAWVRFFPSLAGDSDGVWELEQGVGNAQRVGNKIKVKKWLIKGLIQPTGIDDSQTIAGSRIGYVTVYLGRLQSGDQLVGETLPGLFQQGNTSITPVGQSFESLYATNTDKYKVYAKKTFKMGNDIPPPGSLALSNNDFSLTAKFTFDVTKYVFKNRHVMYDDENPTPQNFDMSSLCVWAVFQPAVGVMGLDLTQVNYSYYSIQPASYGNYEDA